MVNIWSTDLVSLLRSREQINYFLVLLIYVLIGLFFIFKNKEQPDHNEATKKKKKRNRRIGWILIVIMIIGSVSIISNFEDENSKQTVMTIKDVEAEEKKEFSPQEILYAEETELCTRKCCHLKTILNSIWMVFPFPNIKNFKTK